MHRAHQFGYHHRHQCSSVTKGMQKCNAPDRRVRRSADNKTPSQTQHLRPQKCKKSSTCSSLHRDIRKNLPQIQLTTTIGSIKNSRKENCICENPWRSLIEGTCTQIERRGNIISRHFFLQWLCFRWELEVCAVVSEEIRIWTCWTQKFVSWFGISHPLLNRQFGCLPQSHQYLYPYPVRNYFSSFQSHFA